LGAVEAMMVNMMSKEADVFIPAIACAAEGMRIFNLFAKPPVWFHNSINLSLNLCQGGTANGQFVKSSCH
jgi:hypothetical protein